MWTLKHRFGLRTKSVLALLIACLIAITLAGLIGWQVLKGIQEHFSSSYVRNFTLLKKQEILAPVTRELALSLRLADSVVTKSWLLDESDPEKTNLFFNEAEGYRKDFSNHSYFIASANSGNYYFANGSATDGQPNYQLKPDAKSDTWFYNTLESPDQYNINVNYDEHLKLTQIWFNSIIRKDGKAIGLTGSSLDLTEFIKNFIITNETGLTPMILAENGAIQAHKDFNLIANNQTTGTDNQNIQPEQTLAGHLNNDAERERLYAALQEAKNSPNNVAIFQARIDNSPQLIALSYIPDLKWFVTTAMDLQTAQFLNQNWVRSGLILLLILLVSLLVGFGYAVEQIILKPIRKLQLSAIELTQGNYEHALPNPSNDEIGDLSKAFASMSAKVREQMTTLEDKVASRTKELTLANEKMQKAYQQINDSIQYASLIQHAILPEEQLKRIFGDNYFLIWQPRDIVGGDFYIVYEQADSYLLGVIDCAGHGVPGALMTMLTRAALDSAIQTHGISDPAAILQELDSNIRTMLQEQTDTTAIATNLDAGLILINTKEQRLRFAGAKIDLYWSDGNTVNIEKSCRRAIGDRNHGIYTNINIALRHDVTYTLTTDGILDQAGGRYGYGFGNKRFDELLLNSARHSISEQADIFNRTLTNYRGKYTQRDDITVLSFRFNSEQGKYDQD